MLTHLCKITWK